MYCTDRMASHQILVPLYTYTDSYSKNNICFVVTTEIVELGDLQLSSWRCTTGTKTYSPRSAVLSLQQRHSVILMAIFQRSVWRPPLTCEVLSRRQKRNNVFATRRQAHVDRNSSQIFRKMLCRIFFFVNCASIITTLSFTHHALEGQ